MIKSSIESPIKSYCLEKGVKFTDFRLLLGNKCDKYEDSRKGVLRKRRHTFHFYNVVNIYNNNIMSRYKDVICNSDINILKKYSITIINRVITEQFYFDPRYKGDNSEKIDKSMQTFWVLLIDFLEMKKLKIKK